ncbi:TolC family protein [Salmonella enterica subsp. enterica serovar Montevideo]|uniref:Efflux transporter outer membrane subunit n=4 Tax=Salmonella enterica TaxID=28901 RepID=A0A617LUG6_SALMO|nr:MULTISPECIES: efflux transporter outer membrane subunit [Enterobacteriaceae]EAC1354482.1 efflux transporter outer membrane subunit [Salmonella enterica subsp. enterica serovar Montevideo]EAY2652828.1 efflux transporter outer membrane subunit [Salmonella enterica subsp. enterica serovar Dublin]EAZ9633827.1 efflux transporter outer membrane subunit [Salmonella enterica subsp. enterica serovar Typhimurium]EBC0059054.1 efflux transporter outer membrane subunit [Salmonella enterica subsp. enteric
MKNLSSLTLCLITALCSGCTNVLKSDYRVPEVNYPINWTKGDLDGNPAPFDWKEFNDPHLDNWLHQVMTNNNDMAIAAMRVYRARLDAERTGITNTPALKGSLGVDGKKQLNNSSGMTKSGSFSLNTSYELELWGKIARQRDVAEWAVHASEEDFRSARLTLLAEASNNYWRIGFVNQQIAILQQSIDYAKETLRLAEIRYRAGSTSLQDVIDAQQNLLTQENQLTGLQRERSQVLNKQAVLLGTVPGCLIVEPTTLPKGSLPKVNANIPARVLMRRPDISAKEWQLREALATVDIKRSEYYPTFNLTGALGTSSTSLLSLLHNPVGSVGANLTLPFLEWRQRDIEVKIARNDYEQRVLEFKQLLYKAMSSIEDALSLRNQLMVQEARLRDELELARKSEWLNKVRYQQGAVRISFWLDAQEKRRQVEFRMNENRFNQLQNLAKIYLEFGGTSTFP